MSGNNEHEPSQWAFVDETRLRAAGWVDVFWRVPVSPQKFPGQPRGIVFSQRGSQTGKTVVLLVPPFLTLRRGSETCCQAQLVTKVNALLQTQGALEQPASAMRSQNQADALRELQCFFLEARPKFKNGTRTPVQGQSEEVFTLNNMCFLFLRLFVLRIRKLIWRFARSSI